MNKKSYESEKHSIIAFWLKPVLYWPSCIRFGVNVKHRLVALRGADVTRFGVNTSPQISSNTGANSAKRASCLALMSSTWTIKTLITHFSTWIRSSDKARSAHCNDLKIINSTADESQNYSSNHPLKTSDQHNVLFCFYPHTETPASSFPGDAYRVYCSGKLNVFQIYNRRKSERTKTAHVSCGEVSVLFHTSSFTDSIPLSSSDRHEFMKLSGALSYTSWTTQYFTPPR